MSTCNHCHITTDLFFCPQCGQVFQYPDFVKNDKKRERALETYIKNMISTARQLRLDLTKLVDKSNVANLVFRKYYEHIAYLQQMCSCETAKKYFEGNGTGLFDKMNEFAEKCKLNVCQIAVVGTVKAGKSMFINALLDKEIASSYPTPETASVTKFCYSNSGDYVKASFYTQDEWNALWKSAQIAERNKHISDPDRKSFLDEYRELKAEDIKHLYINKGLEIIKPNSNEELKQVVDRFTSARYAEHFFVKEAEVGLSDFIAPANVVFVDTPGLNDPVKFRSDMTRHYLKSANVILLCIRSMTADISSSELGDLSSVFSELRYVNDRIYVFGTQIDSQVGMMDYWKDYTLPFYLKYLSSATFYGSKENALKHIFPVTAKGYNLIQQAKTNPSIWSSESNEKIFLKEMISRIFNLLSYEDCVERYGEDDAAKYYKGPKSIFNGNIEKLEQYTQIPYARKIIMEGPIRDAQRIILQDIKDNYQYLCKEIDSTSTDIIRLRKQTIEESCAGDVRKRIDNLTQRINDEKRENASKSEELRQLLHDIQVSANNEIENEKKN